MPGRDSDFGGGVHRSEAERRSGSAGRAFRDFSVESSFLEDSQFRCLINDMDVITIEVTVASEPTPGEKKKVEKYMKREGFGDVQIKYIVN